MRAFVIAMESEAAVVRPFLKDGDRLYVAGVGKVNAASATQKAIDAGADEILNCGVAGGFDPAMKIADVFEIDRAVEYDFDLAQLNGTEVGVHNERTTPYFGLQTRGLFPARTLGSGDRFSDSQADLPVLARLGVTIRDMEGAAIAHVCEMSGVPCRILKCLSDVHGQGAMTDQYKANLSKALLSLVQAFPAWCGK
ncbi:MAG: 5'-methylthioadenosine/S-adenosylhomocysteine nucleosidase [Kiritimatiellae bacterium]|nr:5'-methylthioadenosine/S-adenosylhomocysteine nucleosidase [Kiritimatiellia bacterium]